MWARLWRILGIVACAAGGTAWLLAVTGDRTEGRAPVDDDISAVVAEVDGVFARLWEERGIVPAERADELIVARRMALALVGSIPSLEEIRLLQEEPEGQRADVYLARLLGDARFYDYFAERLARSYVGNASGPFLVYRRSRFVAWLSEGLAVNRPYDEVVRDLVASEGLWTDEPGTNFITAHERDAMRLTARSVRAFLGLRLDCVECHDDRLHSPPRWRQDDFHGIAAFYANVEQNLLGIRDAEPAGGQAGMSAPLVAQDGSTMAVPPAVPFDAEALPDDGSPRERLAEWIVTQDDQRYNLARATVSRVWALMFGQGLVDPVDDLSSDPAVPEVLDLLARDFRESGYNLRRLIRTIASLRVFRLDSAYEGEIDPAAEQYYAVFPLSRLRPEQVAGAAMQASSLRTLDADSNLLVRTIRSVGVNEFVKRYGDAGEDELGFRAGTIPQRLLMMNGELVSQRLRAQPMGPFASATGRIGMLAPDDATRVCTAYLVCLTREPSREEIDHFTRRLADVPEHERGLVIEDMCWALLNSTEFAWNH